MPYEEIIVDNVVLEHFGRIHQYAYERVGPRWVNPQIVRVWREHIGKQDNLYWVQVKTGNLGDHHHFTVVFEVRHGHEKLIELHEGHKTFF